MSVSRSEFRWREWILGEGEFAGHGPRSLPRPNVGYGGPGQTAVPQTWWQRLEAFLAQRADYGEPGRKGDGPHPVKPGPATQLSPHFNVREFDCHDGRKVPAVAVHALTLLCLDILEPLHARFGVGHVLSGYRPADYNKRIGGATYSQHIYELTPGSVAADMQFAHGSPDDWAAFADTRLAVGGLGVYPTSGFCHFDNRPIRARWRG